MTVRAAVEELDGVAQVDASHQEERVDVSFDPDRTTAGEIRRAIEAAGYQAGSPADHDPAGDG